MAIPNSSLLIPTLPKTTEFNRRIPKQKFYENLSVTPALKRVFVEQIKTIWWRNKIAASTMNLAAGGSVTELEVFELQLSQPSKVNRYYHTDWLDADKLALKAEGLSLDAVYESFVRQIAGDALTGGQEESLKESVEREQKQQELEKKIAALQAKIRKEKQLNRQMELNAELKKVRRELEEET